MWYNNLLTTKHFLEANNIKKDKINIYDVDKDELIDLKYDLVISLVSWGYHYPLETYIDYLKKNATNKTIFIFDIAAEYISIEDVKKYSGQTLTLSYWAKGSNPNGGTFDMTWRQDFGTGGSNVLDIGVGSFSITGTWTK